MPRTKSKAARSNQNEDSKSEVSANSRTNTRNQRGKSSARKGKSRTSARDRSASKTRQIKEETPASQPMTRKASVGGVEVAQVPASKPTPATQASAERASMMRRQPSGQAPPHPAQRPNDPRYAGQHGSAQPGAAGHNYQQRMPSNIPPQITAADAQRAQAQIPSDMELVESEIAGEKVKASLKTIDYLKRFETFLNKTPNEKIQLLNERFFRKIPRDHGVFKTNRNKGVRCPV